MDGNAWRYILPPQYIDKLSINLLEFIASTITIYLTITTSNHPHKILALTDSLSALGWLHKASFPQSHHIHNKVARHLALSLIDHDSSLYSQHIPGRFNVVADMLSRDHHISDKQLTFILRTIYPTQTPQNYRLSPLPPKIIEWLHSLMPSLTKPPASPPHRSRNKLGALTDGRDSCQALASKMNGLTSSLSTSKHISSPPLRAAVEEMSMGRQGNLNCPDSPLKPPLQMYAWPFGRIYGQTQL